MKLNEPLKAARRQLCRRAIEHAARGTTDLAPHVMRNDVRVYTDAAHFTLEQQKLFREMPIVVCLAADLPNPGSYRIFDDSGVPIFVIRGKDRVVRAFLNICRHRGSRLLRNDAGKVNLITCRFHGWSYNSQGKCAAVPQSACFGDLCESDTDLIPCPAAERQGLIFVKPTPNSTIDIDAHLGDFGAELRLLELDSVRPVIEGELRVACNWKYAFDTYFENYHFATLHRDSIGTLFLNNLCLFDEWGLHHRLMFPPKEVKEWSKHPESEWPIETINTPYFIFPNTIVYSGSLKPGSSYMTTFRLFPMAVGETITRIAIYAPNSELTSEYRAEIEATFAAMCALVGNEDYSVTAESWRHLAALPKDSAQIYGRQEIAVQSFHRKLAAVLTTANPTHAQVALIKDRSSMSAQ
jgi:phenylpropionate dioxygenase-like ring-hydroxylating dioxygenase large terminal subunit